MRAPLRRGQPQRRQLGGLERRCRGRSDTVDFEGEGIHVVGDGHSVWFDLRDELGRCPGVVVGHRHNPISHVERRHVVDTATDRVVGKFDDEGGVGVVGYRDKGTVVWIHSFRGDGEGRQAEPVFGEGGNDRVSRAVRHLELAVFDDGGGCDNGGGRGRGRGDGRVREHLVEVTPRHCLRLEPRHSRQGDLNELTGTSSLDGDGNLRPRRAKNEFGDLCPRLVVHRCVSNLTEDVANMQLAAQVRRASGS
mmetsp:Transcript_8571/g.20260  ORF Transcript_8571/g.20260 Transcript_8571/m.20260 type:complete len:250 (-) Transcript_8571:2754-3503(-)